MSLTTASVVTTRYGGYTIETKEIRTFHEKISCH